MPRYYRIESENANRQYLSSCLPSPTLTETSAEQTEAICKGVVQAQNLQTAFCPKQLLKDSKQGSLTTFCSKSTLLRLKHSMQPQKQPLSELPMENFERPPSDPQLLDFVELEPPVFAKVHVYDILLLHNRGRFLSLRIFIEFEGIGLHRKLLGLQSQGLLLPKSNSPMMMPE